MLRSTLAMVSGDILGCLGALDGTHVEVRVADSEKGRYWNRKGQIFVNVLGVCDIEGKFIYVLSGWEGSAADSRILRDAVNRPTGLKVPNGNYYLCDNGYPNGEGFLTPYRGVRYHLKEWDRGGGGPQSPQELFNLKHASARNVIERTFGLLKTRWGFLEALHITQSKRRIMSLNDEEGTSKPRRCRDPTAMTMRYKSWPFFPAWREIFRKDRASGEQAEDINEIVNEKIPLKTMTTMTFMSQWHNGALNLDSPGMTLIIHQTHKDTLILLSTLPPATRRVRAQLKRENDRLGELAKKLFFDYEEVEKRSGVYEAVGNVLGIDLTEQLLISDRLVENPKKMDLFFSLPDDARARMPCY
ncbi:hypothetical protein Sango_2431000 [Sesamum angolense]|uniref:DDE Tnp4 domain-containing protein n=1 Tax=Sesamum angolense TaxID=2727404 RepID=A0AAE1W7U9_9LAMI|nr:hypothetical protein Sango_2431000 [Sesamum angolense]